LAKSITERHSASSLYLVVPCGDNGIFIAGFPGTTRCITGARKNKKILAIRQMKIYSGSIDKSEGKMSGLLFSSLLFSSLT